MDELHICGRPRQWNRDAVTTDEAGRKWFGTAGGGISTLSDGVWETLTTRDLVGIVIYDVSAEQGSERWFAGLGGVSSFDGTTWTAYTSVDGLCDYNVSAVALDDRGHKWFGTYSGASQFDGATWTTHTSADGLVDDRVLSIAVDGAGHKWFGTEGGVSEFDGTTWTSYTYPWDLRWVNAVAVDRSDHKWFGTLGAGVFKLDGDGWTNYTTADGLPDPRVEAITVDRVGRIWVGTWQGVSVLDGSTWTTYTTADGLAADRVTGIAADQVGNLWIGTSGGGVSRFDGSTWTTYTTSQGLVANWVFDVSVDPKGHTWIVTNSGVSEWVPDGVLATATPSEGVTLVYTDTQGSPISIEVPSGAVTETTTLVYTPIATTTVPSGLSFAGRAFGLKAFRNGSSLPQLHFQRPVSITIHYTDEDVAGLDEASLELRVWDDTAWTDQGIDLIERNPAENYARFAVAHLSEFTLVGEPLHRVCLPLAVRAFSSSPLSFELGGHIHDWSFPHASQVRYAGMNWATVRARYPEDVSGIIAASHARGFKIQVKGSGPADMVTHPGFEQDVANWLAGLAVAGADAIEVWNEPNIDREWQSGHISAALYTDLLCASYHSIKAANSDTLVISAAPAPTGFFGGCSPAGCDDVPWLQALYAEGAANCTDYLGAHHASGATSPSARSGHPADGGGRHHSWYFLPQTELYYNAFQGTRRIFYTLLGYASQEGVPPFSDWFAWANGTSNADQAAWLAEAAELSISTGMVDYIMIWNIDFPRYTYDPMDGYAIIRPDESCPACESLHALLGAR